jgi:hypothetical protein
LAAVACHGQPHPADLNQLRLIQSPATTTKTTFLILFYLPNWLDLVKGAISKVVELHAISNFSYMHLVQIAMVFELQGSEVTHIETVTATNT